MSAPVIAKTRSFAARRARGFSLVELVITISIVGVLASIATPTMTSLMARHRVADATTDLFSTLLKARGEALMLNRDVNVVPVGSDWASGWRVPDPSQAGKFFDVHEPATSVAIAMSGAPSITYQFNGRVRGGAGVQFDVSSRVIGFATRSCVSVDPSGRPLTKDGPCTG